IGGDRRDHAGAAGGRPRCDPGSGVSRDGHRVGGDRSAVSIEFRELRNAAELAPMPALESRVWGGSDLIAVNMLVATISEGGMAIGAFDGDRLVGSVYGFATAEPHVLHSHYLAVDPDYR